MSECGKALFEAAAYLWTSANSSTSIASSTIFWTNQRPGNRWQAHRHTDILKYWSRALFENAGQNMVLISSLTISWAAAQCRVTQFVTLVRGKLLSKHSRSFNIYTSTLQGRGWIVCYEIIFQIESKQDLGSKCFADWLFLSQLMLWAPNSFGQLLYVIKIHQIQCDHLQPCQKFLIITCDRINYRG